MATSGPRALATDPLRNFKFNIVIPISLVGSKSPGGIGRLGFMQMQGLGINVEPLTYREGGDNLTTRKMPGQADFNPITLSRGLFPTDNDNWKWMNILFTAMYGGGTAKPISGRGVNEGTGAGVGSGPDFRTNMYINILQHPNTTPSAVHNAVNYQGSYPQQDTIVQISFKLYSAWISTLAYSDLDAGANGVAVEQMTLNYEGFDMTWGGSGYVKNPIAW